MVSVARLWLWRLIGEDLAVVGGRGEAVFALMARAVTATARTRAVLIALILSLLLLALLLLALLLAHLPYVLRITRAITLLVAESTAPVTLAWVIGD